MPTTPQSEFDRVLNNPDHVIMSDELADQITSLNEKFDLDISASDTQLLEIDGRAFVASLVKAKRLDSITDTWEVFISVPGLAFDDIVDAEQFLFSYNDTQFTGAAHVEFALEGLDRFLTLTLRRILTKDE